MEASQQAREFGRTEIVRHPQASFAFMRSLVEIAPCRIG